jgi:hypothetical protein
MPLMRDVDLTRDRGITGEDILLRQRPTSPRQISTSLLRFVGYQWIENDERWTKVYPPE